LPFEDFSGMGALIVAAAANDRKTGVVAAPTPIPNLGSCRNFERAEVRVSVCVSRET